MKICGKRIASFICVISTPDNKFTLCIIASRLPGLGHHNISSSPVEVGGDLAGVEVQQISTYGDCSLALSRDGQLYGWGNSEYLQLSSVTEATQVTRANMSTSRLACRSGGEGFGTPEM